MGERTKEVVRNHIDIILALATTIVLMVVLAIFFDFRYDLNDDVLIHDIVSGNYTGDPEGRTIQMLYPLGAIIALAYRLIRTIPWFGMFLCGSQFLCCYLILKRVISYAEWIVAKVLLLGMALSFFLVFQYNTLVVVQYTVVSGLLAATGIFLFATSKRMNNVAEMLRENCLSMVLLLVAFCLREEMVLLFLPLLCVVGIAKWLQEPILLNLKMIVSYLALFGALLVGMLMCMMIHFFACNTEEWNTFQTFFDERTSLYDYAVVPSYEEHQAFYESIEIESSQQALLTNYNFAIDGRIDAEVMSEVAQYATKIHQTAYPFSSRIKESILAYLWRLLDSSKEVVRQSDYPYNYVVIILYIIVCFLVLFTRSYRHIVVIGLLFAVRSGLWIYLIYRMRTPMRITMPLYYVEACILLAMFLYYLRSKAIKKYGLTYVMGVIVLVISSMNMGYLNECLIASIQSHEASDGMNESIREYAKANQENLYLIDVYTFVPFSEKIFQERDNLLDNYGIISGWAATSPLEKKRLEQFGIMELDQAFIEYDYVYFVNNRQYPIEWLVQYYRDQGILIYLEQVATLADGQIQILQARQLQ